MPFIASEVFNCEISKISDLFFTSRAEQDFESKQPPKKEVSSSPLPRDDEEDDEEEEEEEESA